jgi:hypothetical protein
LAGIISGSTSRWSARKARSRPATPGAQPAFYELEGKTVRPLGRETEKSFALVGSLDEAQRKQAVLGFEMHDLVLGPGRDGQSIQPEGIKGSALTEKQRESLLDLAGEWIGIMPEAVAKAKMDEMKKNIGETWFAWSGPTGQSRHRVFPHPGPDGHHRIRPATPRRRRDQTHPHDLPRPNQRIRSQVVEVIKWPEFENH